MRTTTAPERQAIASPAPGIAEALFARVAGEGSAAHPYVDDLLAASAPRASRDLADAVHLLCHLHGRHPGLLDLSLHVSRGAARNWLEDACEQFERERLFLVRLTAAVGPLPSTPGSVETENAILAQRHAIETLASSERQGCALGAAIALAADWRALRPLLDRAAGRAGVPSPPSSLPDDAAASGAIESSIEGPAAQRALAFGAEQLMLQHRGLLDLLEARASARID